MCSISSVRRIGVDLLTTDPQNNRARISRRRKVDEANGARDVHGFCKGGGGTRLLLGSCLGDGAINIFHV